MIIKYYLAILNIFRNFYSALGLILAAKLLLHAYDMWVPVLRICLCQDNRELAVGSSGQFSRENPRREHEGRRIYLLSITKKLLTTKNPAVCLI